MYNSIFVADINECFQEDICQKNEKCQNRAGGYDCVCDRNFERSTTDDKKCDNIAFKIINDEVRATQKC